MSTTPQPTERDYLDAILREIRGNEEAADRRAKAQLQKTQLVAKGLSAVVTQLNVLIGVGVVIVLLTLFTRFVLL
jgi:hypothetical protein